MMDTQVKISYIDHDGYRRMFETSVPPDVDAETLKALVAEIDPTAVFEYAVKA